MTQKPVTRQALSQVENATYLRGRFADALLRSAPRSVIDVGCGRGELLASLREAGVPGFGLEVSPERAAALTGRVVLGRAEQLPVGTASVDWALMRHVAHHLSDARLGVTELARVARSGVLVAEPWRPSAEPAQQTAAALDAWCKRHHRRRGMLHDADVPAEQLADWLQSAGTFEISIEHLSRPVDVLLTEVAADLAAAVDDLPADHDERVRVDDWLDRARSTGVGATGTALVIAHRR